jgi:3-oxoacyl-[acyl-carrier-protein] synthase II
MTGAELDSRSRPVVVVTGMGVLTSLGEGLADNWARLTAGHSGIKRITRFPLDAMKTTIAGTVDYIDLPDFTCVGLAEEMGRRVGEEAVAAAGIGRKGDFPGPLCLALAPVEIDWPHRRVLAQAAPAPAYKGLLRAAGSPRFNPWHRRFLFGSAGETLAEHFGTKGSPITTTTACASGATALQLGTEAIRRGEASAVLCIGTESSITEETLIRFSLLSALSTRNDPPQAASRPFSKDRDGFVMAEGAAALVLESLAHARARGARILGVIEGCGEKADRFHRTRTSPDGKPIIECMASAIADAGLSPEDVDYINAHGTSTPENEKMEWLAISSIFGERATSLPVSSNKSMIGHTMSAAGAIEAVFTFLTILNGRSPPTINYDVPDPALPVDCVPNVARDAVVRHAISNSFGFGGQNVSLLLGTPPE